MLILILANLLVPSNAFFGSTLAALSSTRSIVSGTSSSFLSARPAGESLKKWQSRVAAAIKSAETLDDGLELLNLLQHDDLSANAFGAAIALCARNQDPKRARELLESMSDKGFQPDSNCVNSVLSAYGNTGLWSDALALLETMKTSFGISPNIITLSACISACGKGGQWQAAIGLLESLEQGRYGIAPNAFTFSATINACGRCGRWKEALELFSRMGQSNVEPNSMVFSAIMDACGGNGQVDMAIELLNNMTTAYRVKPSSQLHKDIVSVLRSFSFA